MLNWWLGRATEGSRVADECPDQEPPETPAPVFAARALKSAFFGTPAPVDDTIYEIESDTENMAGKDPRRQSSSMSPTKPQGILLTPGTATLRRKTVSFGTEVVGKEENSTEDKVERRDGNIERESKTETSSKRSRKTSLIKTLEQAREKKTPQGGSDETQRLSESQPFQAVDKRSEDVDDPANLGRSSRARKSNQELMAEVITGDDFDGNMTMDLNDPHSQSGKYWKTEYENYHEGVKSEMKKLLKYKQLAKSYAKKKDAEAIELTAKLKEEQRRVVSMEDKISRLSAEITTTCMEGKDDNFPELVKELARQTALAVQYRAQVEEFQAALEGNDELASGKNEMRSTSSQKEQTFGTHHELKKVREQLKEIKSLREEMSAMRQSLSTAEKANMKLREENTKLTQELLHADLRLVKQTEQSEKRRNSSEDRFRRKDEAYQNLQKAYDNLKEAAKSQRRDAEHLLKKRHEQVVGLKKELASLKEVESTAKQTQMAMEKKSDEKDQLAADYLKQIAELKGMISQQVKVEMDRDVSNSHHRQKRQAPIEPHTKSTLLTDNSHPRDSLIPIPSQSISRPVMSMASSPHPHSMTPEGSPALIHRSSHSVLSEITNNVNKERFAFQKSDSVQFTPLTSRFPNMSLEEPILELSTPELSLYHIPSGAVHQRRSRDSPRPSMFNIASSPPKATIVQSRDVELSRQKSNGGLSGRRHAHVSSSQLSSSEGSRARTALPPERAAAAKARLEQKNAEKKRAQESGIEKENIRS